MRTLLVNDYATGGGAERVAQSLLVAIRESGADAQLLTSEDVPGRRTPWSYISNARASAVLRERLDSFRPELVWLHNYYHELSSGILGTLEDWKAMTGGRVCMTAHDAHLICPNPVREKFVAGAREHLSDEAFPLSLRAVLATRWDPGSARSLLRKLQHVHGYIARDCRSAIDVVFSPSRHAMGALAACGRPVEFLPNPIDRIETPPQEPPTDRVRLAFVGRIEPEKGLAEFAESCPLEIDGQPIELVVVGEGSDRDRVDGVARGRSLRVLFHGRLDSPRVREALVSSHLLVLPTLVRENAPMAMLEAAAAGRPSIATDQPAMRELIEEFGAGAVFDGFDEGSIEGAIRATLGRPPSGAAIESRAPERIVERAFERMGRAR